MSPPSSPGRQWFSGWFGQVRVCLPLTAELQHRCFGSGFSPFFRLIAEMAAFICLRLGIHVPPEILRTGPTRSAIPSLPLHADDETDRVAVPHGREVPAVVRVEYLSAFSIPADHHFQLFNRARFGHCRLVEWWWHVLSLLFEVGYLAFFAALTAVRWQQLFATPIFSR